MAISFSASNPGMEYNPLPPMMPICACKYPSPRYS
jgi:hypothetical protein